jgi:hypothetical protein
MKAINILFTLSSLNVLLVTLERFSFTTKVVLQPYNFLRVHELVQMTFLILFTVIIPCFLLKEITNNFSSLKTKKGQLLGLLFVVGIYFYATGNGLHEVSSFLFNQYCDTKHFTSQICKSMFFNDYYTGNIYFFIGAFMSNLALILLERMNPVDRLVRKDIVILTINSVVYAFTIFAYAAFDTVLVGLVFAIFSFVVVNGLLFTSKQKYSQLPFTLYCAIAYTLGTIASVIIRFMMR